MGQTITAVLEKIAFVQNKKIAKYKLLHLHYHNCRRKLDSPSVGGRTSVSLD